MASKASRPGAPNNRNGALVTLPGGKVERRAPKNHVPSGVRCGAKKKGGGTCNLAAGWGTKHPGSGTCKLHGGAAPSHLRKFWNDELNRTLGTEFEIDPLSALMWLVRLAAGDVQYWRTQISIIQAQAEQESGNAAAGLVENTMFGKQLTLAARKYEDAQDRLAKHSKMAVDAGVAERYVRLQEAYGEAIADLIANIRNDLVAAIPKTHGWIKELVEKTAAEMIPKRLLELETGPIMEAEFEEVS